MKTAIFEAFYVYGLAIIISMLVAVIIKGIVTMLNPQQKTARRAKKQVVPVKTAA